ncbi:unnamed protein product [Trifolium pratense]|uniref:Uncharacterized protein n=1 Tax=Trifolium pratense TaxID=57577 RepID=A0ACB0KH37_TRIPR|nr:unnamed protein product [Trifolium pratense]
MEGLLIYLEFKSSSFTELLVDQNVVTEVSISVIAIAYQRLLIYLEFKSSSFIDQNFATEVSISFISMAYQSHSRV